MIKILVIFAAMISAGAYATETPNVTQLRHDMNIMLAIDSELIVDARIAIDSPYAKAYCVDAVTGVAYDRGFGFKPMKVKSLKERKAYLKRRIEIYNADKKSYEARINAALAVK